MLHNWIQEPKQDDGSSGFACKLSIIKVSHPYLYYPLSFREGSWPIIMRFSIHLYICFQLRHWKKSLGCPIRHGFSSLSSLIPSSYLVHLHRTVCVPMETQVVWEGMRAEYKPSCGSWSSRNNSGCNILYTENLWGVTCRNAAWFLCCFNCLKLWPQLCIK